MNNSNCDVYLLLRKETFFKNFEVCKVRVKESQKWVTIFNGVVARLQLLEDEANVEIVEKVKKECLNLFNNYYVCPEQNVLLPLMKEEEVKETKLEVEKNKEEMKEDEKKEEEFTPIKDKESEAKEKKDSEEEKEEGKEEGKEEEKEEGKEEEAEAKANDDEDVENFLEVLKTPEKKERVKEIVIETRVDIYSILIIVPKEYEFFLRE